MTHRTIRLPPGMHSTSDREVAILQTVGRLGPTRMSDLLALILVGLGQTASYALIARLLERGLLWETRSPGEPTRRPDGQLGPPRSQRVLGLTVEGKMLLEALGAENATTLQYLHARDRRAPAPSPASLVGDLLISAWCASVLDQARRAALLFSILCYTRVVMAYNAQNGQPLHTVGAYLSLFFTREEEVTARPGWHVPWSSESVPQGTAPVRFFLEVDTGRQTIPNIALSAQTYARLSKEGYYTKMLGSLPLPVILTLPGQRLLQVGSAWREAWPATPALISYAAHADHPTYGALWGKYLTLRDSPPKTIHLLAGQVSTLQAWQDLTQDWKP